MSGLLSVPSFPHPEHRRPKERMRRKDRLRQIHETTREQQQALIEEARAARFREQQRRERK
jgi:hypothetical protein